MQESGGRTLAGPPGNERLVVTVADVGDRAVFADWRATIREVVGSFGFDETTMLRVRRTGKTYLPSSLLSRSDIRNGDIIELAPGPGADDADDDNAVTLKVLTGPRKGQAFILGPGPNRIGRAAENEIVIVDPGISRYHASVIVDGTTVRVADAGSTNGVLIGDELVEQPTPVVSGQRILLGQTWLELNFKFSAAAIAAGQSAPGSRLLSVATGVRPHWAYEGERVSFPAAPARPRAWRRSGSEGFASAVELFERSLQVASSSLIKELDNELVARLAEAPSIGEVLGLADGELGQLWPRSAGDPLLARIGLATLPSRIRSVVPDGGDNELRAKATTVVERFRNLDGAPATVAFDNAHSVLVAGHESQSRRLAYSFVAQLAGLHSPGHLKIWAMTSPEQAEYWDWLKWLPHCGGVDAKGVFPQLAADVKDYDRLVEQLVAHVGSTADETGSAGAESTILLIDGQAEVSNRLQALISTVAVGAADGLCVVVVGASDPEARLELPFGRRGSIIIADNEHASMESVIDEGAGAVGPMTLGIDYELGSPEDVEGFARSISPAVPADRAPAEGDADIDLSDEAGTANSGLDRLFPGADATVLLNQWSAQGQAGKLAAQLGYQQQSPLVVDLRDVGPHALVGGELERFLPAWISALAAGYSPSVLNFFLIDSTGGSVFRHCDDLPHTIGTVSDASPLGIKPALATLSAELDRREAVLSSLDCASIEELERESRPTPFPFLIVAVDRVEELGSRRDRASLGPEVSGAQTVVSLDPVAELLSLAERGQQLGLHLIVGSGRKFDHRLSKQIALQLQVATGQPSTMVVGETEPVSFAATLTAPRPEVLVRSFTLADTSVLGRQALVTPDRDDLERLTSLIRDAHAHSGHPSPSSLG